MSQAISDDSLQLPDPFNEPPGDVFELADHIRLDPGLVRDTLRANDIDPLALDDLTAAHISSRHEAASGSDEERLAAVMSAWRDITGKAIHERDDPDEPTGEMQIEEICQKHSFDLGTFIGDISYYGYFHLACPNCGSVSLLQVQYDRVDESDCRHRIQYAYYVMPDQQVVMEFIPDEVGSDEDPFEVAIECRKCGSRHDRGDLVIAAQAHASGYPVPSDNGETRDPAPGLSGDELLAELERLRPRLLMLRDELGAIRKATNAEQLMGTFFPDDELEMRLALWRIEEHVDHAAHGIDEVRRLVDYAS